MLVSGRVAIGQVSFVVSPSLMATIGLEPRTVLGTAVETVFRPATWSRGKT